jgi:2-isopropylmalate synthase
MTPGLKECEAHGDRWFETGRAESYGRQQTAGGECEGNDEDGDCLVGGKTRVLIYDTTLRDGAQGEGISLSADDKLKITRKLDDLGVAYVEGGWPGSNPKDIEYFQRVRSLDLRNIRVAAFGSTRRAGVAVEDDVNIKALLEAETPCVCIFGKTWDFHVLTALQTTMEENLKMIRDSVDYLKAHGREVVYDAEHFFDGFKSNPDYALATLRAAAGADWIVLCDTNGGSLTFEIEEICGRIGQSVDSPLGIHTHNDGDLAVANSIAAVRCGVRLVQGTVNGYGERCGNANLCSVIPNLQLKLNCHCVESALLQHLTEVSHYVDEIANMAPHTQQSFVGASAFAHKAGIHVNAILKHQSTYEHIVPELVGNHRRILVSELSGVSNIFSKARELGFDLQQDDQAARNLINQIKDLEHRGYQFEAADASLELLLLRVLGRCREFFALERLNVHIVKRPGDNEVISTEATIKLRVGDQIMHTAAEGNGPVAALDNALRKALEGFYPCLSEMHLVDYKVRVMDGKDSTSATVRVLIESSDDQNVWSTVGVSENIIEASWQALTDSMNYALLKAHKSVASGQAKLQT